MRIELSEDPRDFARPEWSRLVRDDPGATLFHTPRFLKLYWEEFGAEADLVLAFARDGDRTVGAAAFEIFGHVLRFLGGTEVTDYMGPVAAPGQENGVALALMEALGGLGRWTRADLLGLPEGSRWIDPLVRGASRSGLRPHVADERAAPLLPLPATWEEYLAGLPAKLRHEIRRKARRLEAAVGERRVVFSTPGSLEDDLGLFTDWHRASEGPKGVFMVPGMEIFFRRLGEVFLPSGIFRLAFLEAGGQRLAGLLGFRHRGRHYLYNSAFDPDQRHLAPGLVLVGDLIADAIAAGCEAVDMLKGDLAYKYRFGARKRLVKRVIIGRA